MNSFAEYVNQSSVYNQFNAQAACQVQRQLAAMSLANAFSAPARPAEDNDTAPDEKPRAKLLLLCKS